MTLVLNFNFLFILLYIQFLTHQEPVTILISNFHRVLNVVFFLVNDILASEFCVPAFWNALAFLSS
jgi:hypothetical protein